jgi:hypothetical protein
MKTWGKSLSSATYSTSYASLKIGDALIYLMGFFIGWGVSKIASSEVAI